MSALDDGMRAQHARLAARLAGGMPRAGWKVCVNDARVQKRLGIAGSFVGFLDGSRRLAGGETWRTQPSSVLGVEPEFAVRFAARIDAGCATEEIRGAIEGVAPALEIVDWRDARFDLAALAESSSFHAGFVVGDLCELASVPAIAPGCPLFRRGEEELGVPDRSLVPADLTRLVAQVAAMLGAYGHHIERNDWLLCGACTNPARVEAGDEVEADFATLGSVKVRFVAA